MFFVTAKGILSSKNGMNLYRGCSHGCIYCDSRSECSHNDTEENISGILEMCIEAKVCGVICFGMGLTLREGSREYFYGQLDRLFPGLKEHYIRTYGNQYVVESPANRRLMNLFDRKCDESGMVHNNDEIFRYLHTFEEKNAARQLSLWDLDWN